VAATNGNAIHEVVFESIKKMSAGNGAFTYNYVAQEVEDSYNSGSRLPPEIDRFSLRTAILDYWNTLLRSGVIAFGNESDWTTETFHLTETGRKTLEQFGRDPINRDGYMKHLKQCATLEPIAESYIKEALHTYQAGCHKATAVLVGTGAEGMILHLRDVLVSRLRAASKRVPKDLEGWKIKAVCDEVGILLEVNQKHMPAELSASFATYWDGFTSHIRAIRNKAGHPNSIDPVSPESVHAALLVFPEFAQLVAALETWANAYAF